MFQSTSCLNDQVSIHVSKYNTGVTILKESENTTAMDKAEPPGNSPAAETGLSQYHQRCGGHSANSVMMSNPCYFLTQLLSAGELLDPSALPWAEGCDQ